MGLFLGSGKCERALAAACQGSSTAVAQFELADISKTQPFFLRDTELETLKVFSKEL